MNPTTLLAWFSLVALGVSPTLAEPPAVSRQLPLKWVCEREAAKFVVSTPVRVDKGVRAPKKLRDARPRYPKLPAGTRASGMWIGEMLLDTKGKVSEVWAIREVQFTSPFPAFNKAIVDAIRHWEFEPVVVKGRPTPACMTVSVNINLQ